MRTHRTCTDCSEILIANRPTECFEVYELNSVGRHEALNIFFHDVL